MTIFQIDARIAEFLATHFNEDGEITDIEQFDELQMERDKKIENIALYFKEQMRTAEAIKKEIKALQERQARAERKRGRMKDLLDYCLKGEKFSTPKVSISYRNSTSVAVDDVRRIPDSYLIRTVETKVDRIRIKEAINNGIEVSGAHIDTKRNIQVK